MKDDGVILLAGRWHWLSRCDIPWFWYPACCYWSARWQYWRSQRRWLKFQKEGRDHEE